MKISPKIYAISLIDGLAADSDVKKIAQNLWRLLAKNKQLKDLPKILSAIDESYAKSQNCTLARVYSEQPLNQSDEDSIKTKIKQVQGKDVIIQNTLKPGLIGGILVKIGDTEFDASVRGKVNLIKNKLIH